MSASLCLFFNQTDEKAVLDLLDSHATRVETATGVQWNYPGGFKAHLFIYTDSYTLDGMEEETEIQQLLSLSPDLTIVVFLVQLRLAAIGMDSLIAAKALVALLLSQSINCLVSDNNDVLWSSQEIENGTVKNGLRFLEMEETCLEKTVN